MQRGKTSEDQTRQGNIQPPPDALRDLPPVKKVPKKAIRRANAERMYYRLSDLLHDIPKPFTEIFLELNKPGSKTIARELMPLERLVEHARKEWTKGVRATTGDDFDSSKVKPATRDLIKDIEGARRGYKPRLDAFFKRVNALDENTALTVRELWGWFNNTVENIKRAYRGDDILMHKRHCNLNKKLESRFDFSSIASFEGGTTVAFDLDETIPLIIVDPELMADVTVNLRKNAVDSMRKMAETAGKGYKPAIKVTTRREGERVSFSVEDNGVGFDPSDSERLFGRGYTTKRKTEDEIRTQVVERMGKWDENDFEHLMAQNSLHGHGLALTKQIVEKHGGAIKAESNGSNTGAKFTVTLPFIQ